MDNETKTSLLNKKQDELTVGESLKIGMGVAIVATLVPFVILGVCVGVESGLNKFKARRSAKKTTESTD